MCAITEVLEQGTDGKILDTGMPRKTHDLTYHELFLGIVMCTDHKLFSLLMITVLAVSSLNVR